MILTITLNPSVDISYRLPYFELNETNRSTATDKTAGGKGLNVTRVLDCLQMPVNATGFLGGTNGLFIQKELSRKKINHQFFSVEGDTRNCIAIIHGSLQTEILEEGPTVSDAERLKFLKRMDSGFREADVIVASGSLPKGVPDTFYKELIELAHRYQKPFILDTSGEPLRKALEAGPVFIKPNLSEFEKLMGVKVKSEADVVALLKKFPYPVSTVMVSLGEKGAIVRNHEKIFRISIPKVSAVNPVGSGDAAVAGFAAGLYQGMKDERLFSYSTMMGLLNALEAQTGYVNTQHISRYEHEIMVTRLD